MEFVIVTCEDEQRTVFIDNQEQGMTGRRLSVPEGLHVFDLGVPLDYQPPFQEVPVENTTHTDPMQIEFTLITAREMARRERARKSTSAGTRKRTASKAKPTRKRAGGKKTAGKSKGRKPAGGRRTAKKKAKKTNNR